MKNWNPVICIEIVNYCNAYCPYCPTGNGKLKSKETMAPRLFESIINHLIDIGALLESNNLVLLFNYGEPFLHPDIDRILEILGRYKLKAGFSSNFLKFPKISPGNLVHTGSVVLSLSGMTEQSYGAIHGGDVRRVLANFDRFLGQLRAANPEAVVYVSWHRYRANEDQMEWASAYFKERNVIFRPCLAYLIDLEKNMEVIEAGGISSEEGNKINRRMFLDNVYAQMKSLSESTGAGDFQCPQYDILAVDQHGNLLTCCGLTRYHPDYQLGHLLDLNLEEVYRAKRSAPVCRKCLSYGIPQYMSNDIDRVRRLIEERPNEA